MKKKLISVLLAVLLMLTAITPVLGQASSDSAYPFVFVHGMMGWGENTNSKKDSPYWGFNEENNIPEYLRSKGYEVAVPTVGPLSSAWDRACELYAQLTGTVVDYGEAHSAKMGHARYGRDYTGKSLLCEPWDGESKINLIGHSFGGPTVTVFAYLMANGAAEEVAAAPDNCSGLFTGGHDSVFSVTTFDSPHNGSPVANVLYDTKLPVYAIALFMNLSGMSKNPSTDFMLDQWGITADPSTGKAASLNLSAVAKLAASVDHAAYDMSLQGAKDLQRYTAVSGTYYYSYSAALTTVNDLGITTVAKDYIFSVLSPTATMITLLAGHKIGGVYIDSSWAENDGLVPVPSAQYPQNAENNHADFDANAVQQKGIWYVMPTYRGEGAGHGYGMAGKHVLELYDSVTDWINGLAR